MLKAQDIISLGESGAGISDPERHLHPALHALTASLNGDNRLSYRGEAAVQHALIARTRSRLEGIKRIAQFPEIAAETIRAPIFLTGLPRSGASYLQCLFARDGRFRQMRCGEAPGYGAAPAKREDGEPHRGCAEHLWGECHAPMEQSYAAAGFFSPYDTPSYFDFLMRRMDIDPAYRVHRRQLQLLQWQAEPKRWVLNYPGHLIGMDAIIAVYPDARFVMLHRDPLQVAIAMARTTLALRATRYDPPTDPQRAGMQMMDLVHRLVDRIMAFCTGPHADRIVHVDYYALIADPVRAWEAVQAGLGIGMEMQMPPESGEGWEPQYGPETEQEATGYTLEQLGIRLDLAAEFFGAYRRHFGIAPEKDALAKVREAA